ncbi:hypothetical protein [Arenimonas terrae]|uniref:NlpE C-terminal OB domain-containing protein n=1 Tax=Arenimonas terrae TaxID=2546226 RepID=A0A5C4RPW6_9GAMM|nr:hypothetical protein [Arenimonas terrae]TNJ32979.1 hypothetical protein E1B00_11725 [Arenimonas terrae]
MDLRMPKTLAFALVACLAALSTGAGAETRMRGHYYGGKGFEVFRPCGSPQSFWVVGSERLIQRLRDRAVALFATGAPPARSVYVEVSGVVERGVDPRYVEDDGPGMVRFTSLHRMKAAPPKDCPAHD